MRWLAVLAVPTLAVVGLGLLYGGCGAGGGSPFGDGSGANQGTGANGQGAMGGNLFTGGSGGGDVSSCTDPGCVGSTPQGNCDSGISISSSQGMDGARAIGLCQQASGDKWGVVEAKWVRADGLPLTGGDGGEFGDGTDLSTGKGILSHFGNAMQPREGSKLLALSSGSARNPGDPDFHDPAGDNKDSNPQGAPPGYPKESPSCPGVTTGDPYDSAGLSLKIKTPTDAKSFTFDFAFFTYEYPDFICSEYNDFFVAMLTPKLSTQPDGNISFDAQGNTISVNAGFLQACNPCTISTKHFACQMGYSEIQGTGFESNQAGINCPGIGGSASTDWLVTTAPVESPGSEITLLFAIWDSGDGVLDSTVLIDNFKFDLKAGQVGTVPVPN